MEENKKIGGAAEEGSVNEDTFMKKNVYDKLCYGVFKQLCNYVDYIGLHDAPEEQVMVTALNLAFYLSALDPLIKRELADFMKEIGKVIGHGNVANRLSTEKQFASERLDEIWRGGYTPWEFNVRALKELEGYLRLDLARYQEG